MNLWFRLLFWLLALPRRARMHPLDSSRLDLRVMPSDLDINMHMNNGRYLSLMDIGRMDLMARTGMGSAALKRRWQPIAGAISIRYVKPLRPFQRFTLETRVLGWDQKWFYLQQTFWSGEQLVAQAYFKGLLVGGGRSVPSADLLGAAGYELESPEIPHQIQSLFATEESGRA